MTDTSGTITDTYFYTAFGDELAKTGTTENEFRYVGEQWDPNAGFYYNRARWMNPSIGRFISVDPYAGDPQVAVSLHRYLYSNMSPVNFNDPSGEFTMGEILIASAIVGVLTSALTVTYGYIKYGKFPSKLRGTIIHEAIFPFYEAVGFLCNRWIAKKNNPPIDRSRPDCRHHGPGIYTGEVYEIKPVGRASEGILECDEYINVLNSRYPSIPWHPGASPLLCPSYLKIPEFPFLLIHVFIPQPGLILYEPTPNYLEAARYGVSAMGLFLMMWFLKTNVGEGFTNPVPVPAG